MLHMPKGEAGVDAPSECRGHEARLREAQANLERMAREFECAQREHAEFIDNIDGIVWEANAADLHFTLVSKQAERLLGYPSRCWLEEPDFWVNHLHPDDRKWAPAFCVKATAECRPHELEYRMVAADGRTVWLRDIVTVIVEDQRPIKLRGIMVDVSEQHWNKERLQHTVSLLQATLDSTTDGLLVVDLQGRIVAYNRRYQDMWRIPDEVMDFRRDDRVIGHVLGLLEHPEQFLARVQELYATPDAESLDDHIELRDGRVIERASAPQRQGETIIGRVWSFRDVTLRVRAEQERDRLLVAEQAARVAAEESFALLDTFLNNAPIGLGFLDRGLRYLRLNDTLAALHGRTRQEEVGMTVREATPYMAPLIEPHLRRVLQSGEPIIDLELTGMVPATPGEERHWRVSYYPVQTSSGGIVGVGAVVVEVTAERRAQAEREQLLSEAHEAIRMRDDFLSIASHELKTPLTPLKLHLQMLMQRGTGQPAPSAIVEKALAQVKRLSVLINDLLDTSRIGAGRLELECRPMRLQGLVREVLADFRPVSVHHELECEEPEEDIIIQGDRGRLAQVLTNLLENAIKYSPTGGRVRVTCAMTGAEVVVSVADSGIGIPADQQKHLFERFFRARNAPISGFGGLGLGLYICRDIVERHGGRIWVESEVGKGATFRFTLPLSPHPESLEAGVASA